jgi:hypothetical protein
MAWCLIKHRDNFTFYLYRYSVIWSFYHIYIPFQSVLWHSSQTRADWNLMYWRGALKSEQSPHTTWQNISEENITKSCADFIPHTLKNVQRFSWVVLLHHVSLLYYIREQYLLKGRLCCGMLTSVIVTTFSVLQTKSNSLYRPLYTYTVINLVIATSVLQEFQFNKKNLNSFGALLWHDKRE